MAETEFEIGLVGIEGRLVGIEIALPEVGMGVSEKTQTGLVDVQPDPIGVGIGLSEVAVDPAGIEIDLSEAGVGLTEIRVGLADVERGLAGIGIE